MGIDGCDGSNGGGLTAEESSLELDMVMKRKEWRVFGTERRKLRRVFRV